MPENQKVKLNIFWRMKEIQKRNKQLNNGELDFFKAVIGSLVGLILQLQDQ